MSGGWRHRNVQYACELPRLRLGVWPFVYVACISGRFANAVGVSAYAEIAITPPVFATTSPDFSSHDYAATIFTTTKRTAFALLAGFNVKTVTEALTMEPPPIDNSVVNTYNKAHYQPSQLERSELWRRL